MQFDKRNARTVRTGLLHACRDGTSRTQWVIEGLEELLQESRADRVGIWLESSPSVHLAAPGPLIFRGRTRDARSEFSPDEWTRLSPWGPFARQHSTYEPFEWNYDEKLKIPILGPLIGMRRAIWIPVIHKNLRGLVMTATSERKQSLVTKPAERIADALVLGLELEAERNAHQLAAGDLALLRKVEMEWGDGSSSEPVLQMIAESCLQLDSMGVRFAAIGDRSMLPVIRPSEAGSRERLLIRALSGENAWRQRLQDEPLANLWRSSIERGETVGFDAAPYLPQLQIGRIIALPLLAAEDSEIPQSKTGNKVPTVCGELVVGLATGSGSLDLLERLEFRARLAAETLARERRQLLRGKQRNWQGAVLRTTAEALVVVDRQGALLGISGAAQALLNTGQGQAASPPGQGQRFAELFRPRDWEPAHEWLTSCFEKSGFWATAADQLPELGPEAKTPRLELASGLAVRPVPRFRIDQDFAGIALRRDSQQELGAVLQDEVRQALEWLEEGFLLLSKEGEIRFLNGRLSQLLGIPPGDVMHLRTVDDLLQRVLPCVADPDKLARQWNMTTVAGSEGIRDDLELQRPVALRLERFSRPILDELGQVAGRVEIYRDATASQRFQTEMQQAERLAMLGQQVSSVAHDLASPLTSILYRAERLLQRVGRNSPAAGDLGELVSEAERASRILRQLLQGVRETRPERRLLSLNELVQQSVARFRAAAPSMRLQLKVNLESPLPLMSGDWGQIQQVLFNLLLNAQQAIEESGVGSCIEVRTRKLPGEKIALEVRDDGPGVPAAIEARIFDPFFTTKPVGVGTGLGLAIVYGFVRENGGIVRLVHPPEGGAQFTVELPTAGTRAERPDEVDPAETSSAIREKNTPGAARISPNVGVARDGARKALVIEDEPSVSALIADLLRDEGFAVDVVSDGVEALQHAQAVAYDLAICDLKMPKMDGQRFYSALEQGENPLGGRVLFVTGDTIAVRTREFLERHQLPCVAKPFRMDELTAAVSRLFASTRSERTGT